MTMYEMNFSLLVEDTLKNIVLPEYRQIIVEVHRANTSKCTEGSENVVNRLLGTAACPQSSKMFMYFFCLPSC